MTSVTRNGQPEIWQVLDSRGIGGIESQTQRLARAMNARGIANRVVLLGDYGVHPMETPLEQNGIPLTKVTGGLLGFFRLLTEAKPRLVHTRGYKGGIYGRLLCRLLGISVVSHFHAGEPGEGKLRIYNMIDGLTSVLAPAMAVSKPIADRISATPIIINNMADIPPKPVDGSGTVIAFVGRLSHEKGPDRFLELARALPKQAFEVFGDGPMSEQLQAEAPDNVVFHGMVEDLAPQWPRIGLLCMPSRHEGLPNAALEAMAHGIPVAAFAVGDLPRLLADGAGWVSDEGDMISMQHVIKSWSEMSVAIRLMTGLAGRKRVIEHHGPAAVLPTVFRIYQKALPDQEHFCSAPESVAAL